MAASCLRRLEPPSCGRSCSITGITIGDNCSYTCACSMCPSRRSTARPRREPVCRRVIGLSHMAYDEKLAERIRHAFGERRDVTERKMFGGLAFLCRGRMCCGIVGTALMVRVADADFDAVMRGRHVRPMDFTGKPLRGFVYVSPPGFRTAAALCTWLSRGERVAEEKAAEPAKRSSRRRTSSGVRRATSRARRSQRG